VVCSDFLSSAVALVDPTGTELRAPVLIHSGSRPPQLQTALSGDVVLPTVPPPDGAVLLIDRYPNSVLTFVNPSSAAVERQVSVATGFASNPHDVIVQADGRLLVTRYEPNPTPERLDGLDLGDDVLVLTAAGEPESRFGLTGDDGFPARPDRLLEVSPGRYWVSLGRISVGWGEYRSGQVAVLEWMPTDKRLHARDRLDLAPYKNCGAMAQSSSHVAVSCTGGWRPKVAGFDRSGSGVVVLDKFGATVAMLSAEDARLNSVVSAAVVFGPDGAIYVTQYGDSAGNPDRVLRWDHTSDQVEVMYEALGPWLVWSLARASDGVPLMPDGDPKLPRLCRLGKEPTCFNPCTVSGLPPKAVAPYLAP